MEWASLLLAILEEACPRASAEYRNYIADT